MSEPDSVEATFTGEEGYEFTRFKDYVFVGGPMGGQVGSAQMFPTDRTFRFFRIVGNEIEEAVYDLVARDGELVAEFRGT